jgi:hypothetical protein
MPPKQIANSSVAGLVIGYSVFLVFVMYTWIRLGFNFKKLHKKYDAEKAEVLNLMRRNLNYNE